MIHKNNLLKRIKRLTQEKTGITNLENRDKRTVLTKMCIAYLASEVYGITKKSIAEELGTSGRLIRYYVTTFPHELKINPEFRAILRGINDHPDLNKEYFTKKSLEFYGKEPQWNVWIDEHRFLCQLDNLIIDPDMNKIKSEILFKKDLRWVLWDLIDLQDDTNINIIYKIIEDGKKSK